MSVEIKIPTILRKHTGGEKIVQGEGKSVREVLANVDSSYPGIRSAIVTENGDLQRFINIYLNDEDIRFLGALETPVSDGDTLSILPAVAGG